jgi:hypothetical protein
MQVSADPALNAKLVVKVSKTSSESVTVFLQPNAAVIPTSYKNR